jgi:hypothetical protein
MATMIFYLICACSSQCKPKLYETRFIKEIVASCILPVSVTHKRTGLSLFGKYLKKHVSIMFEKMH